VALWLTLDACISPALGKRRASQSEGAAALIPSGSSGNAIQDHNHHPGFGGEDQDQI
jgi:hypothetical protein